MCPGNKIISFRRQPVSQYQLRLIYSWIAWQTGIACQTAKLGQFSPKTALSPLISSCVYDEKRAQDLSLWWHVSQKPFKVSQPTDSIAWFGVVTNFIYFRNSWPRYTTWQVTQCALIGVDTSRDINNRQITELQWEEIAHFSKSVKAPFDNVKMYIIGCITCLWYLYTLSFIFQRSVEQYVEQLHCDPIF